MLEVLEEERPLMICILRRQYWDDEYGYTYPFVGHVQDVYAARDFRRQLNARASRLWLLVIVFLRYG